DHITVNFKQGSKKDREMREMLEKTLKDYHNRIIQAADVVRMMVEMKKDVDQEAAFRKELGLSDEEAEFYKAITALDLDAFDNQFLANVIHKIEKELKKNLGEDWTSDNRKNNYAKVKLAVKKVLLQEKITGQQLEFITNAVMKEAEKQ